MDKVAFSFRILDETVSFEASPLPDQIRLDQALEPLRILDDQAVEIAVRKKGQPVTCRKGCSTCCRIQPVPVTPTEAYAIWAMVKQLPEPRRSEIVARFDECVERLRQAGLADVFLEGRDAPTPEVGRANAKRYLDLGLACPFLEDDCCSIYEARPFTCREYLVTSPKELCADPLSSPVDCVPIILMVSAAMLEAASQFHRQDLHRIPLTLALVYADSHREELERAYPASVVLAQLIQRVFMAAAQHGSILPETA